MARRFITQVGLKGFEDHHPKQLSGGMQQRTALARALANDPRMLLMDEPFGALDHQTRELMQDLLLGIWEAQRKTVLFVTHDIDEAVFMGSRVVVMSARPGRIKIDRPVDAAAPAPLRDEDHARLHGAEGRADRGGARRGAQGRAALTAAAWSVGAGCQRRAVAPVALGLVQRLVGRVQQRLQ